MAEPHCLRVPSPKLRTTLQAVDDAAFLSGRSGRPVLGSITPRRKTAWRVDTPCALRRCRWCAVQHSSLAGVATRSRGWVRHIGS
jgi:hypothetical protein